MPDNTKLVDCIECIKKQAALKTDTAEISTVTGKYAATALTGKGRRFTLDKVIVINAIVVWYMYVIHVSILSKL